MKQLHIGFIGGGNMATAIIQGIVLKKIVPNENIHVFDVSKERCDYFKAQGLTIEGSAVELAENCDDIFLAVKPQIIEGVLQELHGHVDEHHVVVSIAAGISDTYIKKMLGFDCKVVLVMPNTPLLIGYGASALAKIDPVTDEEFTLIKNIFASVGAAAVIDKEKMNEIIPVNGSSPAFIYLLGKIVSDYAETLGIDRETANTLFCNTLIGSAHMMLETGKSHDELIRMVCSPGGTTLKLMDTLEKKDWKGTLEEAMRHCIDRAYELGR
ncbi:pyrroline-5-carboxylate reductase [Zongyangia hominis]|uniref:Pyrroline-5-carboxylate reductase n=1 Tax=Zongyangia hominis TaxID=2763677 RepID=A0A926IAY0_9FIRM|nr:pyrroline-5-carboxylate reductase [Zongyangia hominis]MBC8569582.1 pyrroline-5-carboxylate reductase [Zongyangia hominis]